jgi:2-polyprenyl-3-methyl-5-hydroxy-6-metoxy-1,4-benzoquinol methylase
MNTTRDDLWNRDDQFKNQFSTESQKKRIMNRWRVFKNLIKQHNFKPAIKLRVLDIGCGDGINILGITNILESLNFNYEITAVDFNEERLNKAKDRFPDITTGKMDIVKDKIDQKFDLIIFNHVLEHIKEDEVALRNLDSILENDGLILLGVPNEGCLIAQIRNNVLHRKILKYTDHVQFYTKKSLSKKVGMHFNIIGVYREGFFMPHDRISRELKRFKCGQFFLSTMLKLIPSQSAGLAIGLIKK